MISPEALENILGPLDGRGRLMILLLLAHHRSPLRFSELQRAIPSSNTKGLTSQLRALENSGLIKRVIVTTTPPKVEYSLSEPGDELRPMLAELQSWVVRTASVPNASKHVLEPS